MKLVAHSNLAGWGFLLLTFGLSPIALPGQTPDATSDQTAKPVPSAPSSVSPTTPGAPAGGCATSNLSMEQMEDAVRNINRAVNQQMRENLAGLSERVQKEVEMNSPELQRLQGLSAQLRSNQSQFEASASELADRAAELAEMAQRKTQDAAEQDPDVLVMSSDDGSGWLGVEIGEVTAEKAKDLKLAGVRGVVVMDVEPDSPAAKAGLKDNDVITQYDGQVVEGTVQFRRLVRETPAGRTVALAISRNGTAQNISVELGDRSAFFEKKMKGKMRDFDNALAFSMPNPDFSFSMPAMDGRSPLLGISAEDVSGQLGSYFGAPDGTGVLVREVRPGMAADKAGLKAGDVIIKVDGKPVRSLAELRAQLRDKGEQKSVNLGILRKGSEMSVAVTMEKPQPVESTNVVHRAQL
ncbi:MAG: PDZ domain-containing protein [Candidatus Acidiferrales bacterium]